MRTASLLFAATAILLAACSEDMPSENAVVTPAATPPGGPAAQQTTPAEKTEQADIAAAEATESGSPPDPCDLSGYDMNHMTVDMHEQLVKSCDEWKATQP